MSAVVVKALRMLHLLVLIFILLAWVTPWQSLLWLHLFAVPLMIIQWQLNQGTCLLTNFENWILGVQIPKQAQQGQFIKGILSKFCHPLPSDQTIKASLYLLLLGLWLVSLFRVASDTLSSS